MKTTPDTAAAARKKLDLRTLGRPVHLLGKFTALLREDLSAVLRTRLNRRYRAGFEVGEVSMMRLDELAQLPRWLMFDAPAGRMGCAVERAVLLCVLDYRYGPGSTPRALDTSRETATEERLAVALARLFLTTLAQRIGALARAGEQPPTELGEAVGDFPGAGSWVVSVQVVERERGVDGTVLLSLDGRWMERLFRGLTPSRGARAGAALGLGHALQLELQARLLEMELPLGILLDARIGDVIPVRLDQADVLVGDSLLFHATVAEHRGKLCLTSFEDVE